MKQYVDQLAVFDLDDTLYIGNSHFALLNEYFHTKCFTSIPIRLLGKFCPSLRMAICNWSYQRIPQSVRKGFTLPSRQEVMELLHQKKKQGYKVVIVSNAPEDLLFAATQKFRLPALSAPFSGKAKVLQDHFEYRKLFVCTDNKTDLDLLYLADEAVLTCGVKAHKFFMSKLSNKNYQFIDDWRKTIDE